MKFVKIALPLFVALAYAPAQGLAAPVLGTELSSFAVLGASTVTNTGPTILTGNLGVSPGSAITGFFGTVANDGPGVFSGTAHQADAFAGLAHSQLGAAGGAIANLSLLGAGTLEPADLVGLTLSPGVYTVPAGTSNLTGTLILDGGGNANAGWVFQMPSTLITSAGSVVKVINTGAGAGVYWNVGSSATLLAGSSFEGNILASASITMVTGATIGCGRALADVGAVTMDTNVVSTGCTTHLGGSTTLLAGSNGLSGGFTVPEGGGIPTPIPPVLAVPEPETYAMLLAGLGLLGFAARRRKQNSVRD